MPAKRPLGLFLGKLKELAGGDVIPIDNLATGTPDGSKYVRDDGVLATVISAVLTGLSVATASAVTAADSILVAIGKLQAILTAQNPTFLSYSGGSQTFATALTLANVNSTTFTFPSTGLYEVEYIATYDANATSTGCWLSVNGTAVHDYLNAVIVVGSQNADRSATTIKAFNAGSASISTSGPTNAVGSVRVSINVTTVGTILLRCSSEITVASGIVITDVKGYMRKKSF